MFSSLKNNKVDLLLTKLIFENPLKKNSKEINNNELNITNISKILNKSPIIKNEIAGKPIISISLFTGIEKDSKEKLKIIIILQIGNLLFKEKICLRK